MAENTVIMRVRAALSTVVDAKTGKNVIAEGRVEGLGADDAGNVRFALKIDPADQTAGLALLEKAKAAVEGVDGVAECYAVATAHAPNSTSASAQQRKPSVTESESAHQNPLGMTRAPSAAPGEDAPVLPDVSHVIAVASGKGGVGKSTIAANLAVAFARTGFKTGFLDADIYGPSAPTLFGLTEKPKVSAGRIEPVPAFGVSVMSMGLIIDQAQALAWRGPMVMGAVKQLINEVNWGALDILIIDTPPGTGDVHLSLARMKRLTGAVIVSTPQEMALADMRRGVELFRKVSVPILGVIENMAWLETPEGAKTYLFGKGGAEEAARQMNAPFLGAVPLEPALRQASDEGAPLVSRAPESATASKISEIARDIAAAMAHAN